MTCLVRLIVSAIASLSFISLVANSAPLFVGRDEGALYRYEGSSGDFLGTTTAVLPPGNGVFDGASAIALGPDGDLYVANKAGFHHVLRFDGVTGEFIDVFVEHGSGGFPGVPTSLAFGSGGDLFLGNDIEGLLYRFDGTDSTFLGTSAAILPPGEGVFGSPTDIVLGPDGNLYVGNKASFHPVLRFDGKSGTFIDVFIEHLSGGFDAGIPLMEFGPPGNFFLGNTVEGSLYRYDGTSGAFLGTTGATLPPGNGVFENVADIELGPDGELYAANRTGFHPVLRFDGVTGEFIDVFVENGSGSFPGVPQSLAFGVPEPSQSTLIALGVLSLYFCFLRFRRSGYVTRYN